MSEKRSKIQTKCIILLKSNKFNMAAVSVKKSISWYADPAPLWSLGDQNYIRDGSDGLFLFLGTVATPTPDSYFLLTLNAIWAMALNE